MKEHSCLLAFAIVFFSYLLHMEHATIYNITNSANVKPVQEGIKAMLTTTLVHNCERIILNVGGCVLDG